MILARHGSLIIIIEFIFEEKKINLKLNRLKICLKKSKKDLPNTAVNFFRDVHIL